MVNLSIRYGIITPYTSYLIEEDDIFSQLGRDRIVEGEIAAEPLEDEAVCGEAAVEKADAFSGRAEAEAPAMAPLATEAAAGEPAAQNLAQAVRFVGSKTFVFRDGRWIDTAYDTTQAVEQVGFGSEAYFDLLTAAPELGSFFALGEQVVVVYGETTYEVVPGAGQETVTLPQVIEPDQPLVSPDLPEVQTPPDVGPAPLITLDSPPTSPALLILGIGVVAFLLIALLFAIWRRSH